MATTEAEATAEAVAAEVVESTEAAVKPPEKEKEKAKDKPEKDKDKEKVKKADSSMQFQIEAENEVQWRGLLRREGLIVIDCYASWAGPCISMVAILKRIKVEVNDDRLWYGVACSDTIDDLMRFKDQSEPCWLFFAGGKAVRVLRGSHVPTLVHAIKSEFAHELECIAGTARRNFITIDDEASRKIKIEAEAAKMSKFVVEEEAAADALNQIRRESSLSLMTALEPYTVAIIQPWLVEDGKAKEIVDFLAGDFIISQQVNFNMTEEWARKLYKIPFEVEDPNQENLELPPLIEDKGGMDEDDNSSRASTASMYRESSVGMDGDDSGSKTPKASVKDFTPKKRMKAVPIPEGLVGEIVIVLLEHEEVKEYALKKMKPINTLLQSADDWLRMKVGPVKYSDAVEVAPYSLHGTYGKSDQLSGVWCPRKYEDKRFVILNFFPTFLEKLLEYTTIEARKYSVAVFPVAAEEGMKESTNVQVSLDDVWASGKMKISVEIADAMLKSWDVKGADLMTKKGNLIVETYVMSYNPKNPSLKSALDTFKPIHVSKDEVFGRQETSKLFPQLKLPLEEETTAEQLLEKFLARAKPRIPSLTAVDDAGVVLMPVKKKKSDTDEAEDSGNDKPPSGGEEPTEGADKKKPSTEKEPKKGADDKPPSTGEEPKEGADDKRPSTEEEPKESSDDKPAEEEEKPAEEEAPEKPATGDDDEGEEEAEG